VNNASELHCLLSEQCNSLINSASELHCSLFFKLTVYQCTLFMLIDCSVNSAISMHSKQEAAFCCFFFSCVSVTKICRAIHSKLCIFLYQIAANCVFRRSRVAKHDLKCVKILFFLFFKNYI